MVVKGADQMLAICKHVIEPLERRVLLSVAAPAIASPAASIQPADAITATPGMTTVSGSVFDDANSNGQWDVNETGLAGREVYVDLNNDYEFDAGDPSGVTNASGSFVIAGIPAGTYAVRQVVPTGWTETSSELYATTTSSNGSTDYDFLFGQRALGATGNFNVNFIATKAAAQPDGKLVIVGHTDPSSGIEESVVARYYPDGILDPTFGQDGEIRTAVGNTNSEANDVLVEPDGDVIVVGDYNLGTDSNGFSTSLGYYLRYTPAGQPDSTFQLLDTANHFGSYGADTFTQVALGSNGQILITGQAFGATEPYLQNGLVIELQDNGSFDSSFGPSGAGYNFFALSGFEYNDPTLASGPAPDGGIYLVASGQLGDGDFAGLGELEANGILSSTLDFNLSAFGTEAALTALDVAANGDIVVAGYNYGGEASIVAELDTNGNFVSSFGQYGSGSVSTDFGGSDQTASAVQVEPDGEILVTGTSAGDVVSAMYTSTGALETTTTFGSSTGGVPEIAKPFAGYGTPTSSPALAGIHPFFAEVGGGFSGFEPPIITPSGVVHPQSTDPAPTAAVITPAGPTTYVFTVRYTLTQGTVARSSLGTGNLSVTGPNGHPEPAIFLGIGSSSTGSDVTASYEAPAPAGGWTSAANGTYSIQVGSNPVENTQAVADAQSGSLGSFTVAVATSLPTPTIFGPGGIGAPGPVQPTLTPTLVWEAAPSGTTFTGYQVNLYNTTTGQLTTYAASSTSTSYTLPSGALTPGDDYAWDLSLQNGSQTGPESQPRLYFAAPGGSTSTLPAPTIFGPGGIGAPGPVQPTLTPTLVWEAAPSGTTFTGYQVNLYNTTTGQLTTYVASSTSTSYTLPSGALTAGDDYAWDLSLQNGSQTGPESQPRLYFAAPGGSTSTLPAPTIFGPGGIGAPGPVQPTLTPTLVWEAAPSGTTFTGYQINLYNTTTGQLTTYAASTASTSYTLPSGALTAGDDYAWDLSLQNGSQTGPESQPRLYFAAPGGSATTLPAPTILGPGAISAAGPVQPTLTPTLVWEAAPSGTTFTGYQVNLYNTTTGQLTTYAASSTSTSYTLPSGALTPGDDYAWDLSLQNGSQTGPESQPRLYFAAPGGSTSTLPAPTIFGPGGIGAPGPVQPTLTPTLVWEAAPSGTTFTGYQINLYNTTTGQLTTYAASTASTSYTLPSGALTAGDDYAWDLSLQNGSQTGPESQPRLYFQVE